jgi:hypothetical protein
MSELVNSSSKSQLSSRNAEPSHLSGAAYDDLGGPTWDHKGGPDAYKIDATKSAKGQDATIPKAVGSEPTHLKTSGVNEDEKVDVDFDGDKEDIKEADDLDKELDKFDDIKEADVEIEVDDEDDKKLKEDVKEVPDAQAKGAETTTDQTDPYVKEDNDDHEGQEGTKLSLSDVQEDDDSEKKDDDKEDLKEGDLPPWLKKDGDKDKGDDDKDKKVDEDEEKDDDKDKIEESVKIRIKLPAAPLFESVNPKARKQVAVIYEQALRATTKQIAEQMQKHYQAKHRKLVEARDRVMAKQVDSYLNYVVEEWSKQNIVPIRQNLRAIKESWKKRVTTVLLENTEKEVRSLAEAGQLNEAAPTNAVGAGMGATAGNIKGFDPILISLIRRAMPNLIAYDLCGVQPMTGPTGLIFALKSRYTSQTGTEALFNEADAGFSSAVLGVDGNGQPANTQTGTFPSGNARAC